MSNQRDLWELAAGHHGVLTVAAAEDIGVPAVEVRKLAARGALQRYGQGVYAHRAVPVTRLTQVAAAVALAGPGAFVERESTFDLLGVGQFNPRKIRVGTQRRVRRALPEWIALERRRDLLETDTTKYEGITSTTVQRALLDMHPRMARERWQVLLDELRRREFLSEREAVEVQELVQ